MTVDLQQLLDPSGVVTSAQLAGRVDPGSITRWVRAGRLLRPLPGVLALPGAVGAWSGRAETAARWAGQRGQQG